MQKNAILNFVRVLNMCQVLNTPEFWILINFHKSLLMWQDPIMEGFWILQEYARGVTSMPGFCICKCCTRFWIWLNNAHLLWCSEYAWSTFHSVLNKHLVQNIPGLRTWQGCEYVRVPQDAEYAWKPEYAFMSQYAWICGGTRALR